MTTTMIHATHPRRYRVRGPSADAAGAVLVTGLRGDDTVFYFESRRDYRNWRAALPRPSRAASGLHVLTRSHRGPEFVERPGLHWWWDGVCDWLRGRDRTTR